MLTLEEFRQSRELEADLAARFGIDDGNGPTRGYVYAGECYIISTRSGSSNLYYLVLGNQEWLSPDLKRQEERLYSGWYAHEHAGERCAE